LVLTQIMQGFWGDRNGQPTRRGSVG
jgi:hypothetical protein